MKRKLFGTFFIVFFLCIFLLYKPKENTPYFKVVEVSNNILCVDLNNNLKCDNDEKFRPLGVSFFSLDEPNLSCASNEFLKDLLLGKKVSFENSLNIFYEEHFKKTKIFFNGEDISLILLKNGFARQDTNFYFPNFNLKENYENIKKNREKFSKYDVRILNTKSKVYHTKECKYASLISNPILMLKENIPKDYKECSLCRVKNNLGRKPEKEVIESRKPDFSFGIFEVFFIDPNKYPYPSKNPRTNLAQALLYNIENSKSTIDFAILGFENQEEILRALINAKKRGVKVRAVVDSNPVSGDVYCHTYKIRENFDTRDDNSPSIMHNKFFIFDGQKVLTTSANISSTGVGGYNSNIGFIINSKVIASLYTKEFEQMFEGKFHLDKEKIFLENFTFQNNSLSVYFSPNSDILTPILNQIKSAKSEICVAAFYLTQRDILSELILAQKRGVRVYVIIDALGAWQFRERINPLRSANIKVKSENWGGKNHQKNILIDSCTLISGSANFSKNAVIKNDENVLIIKSCALGKKYREYFFKLYNSLDEKYLKLYPQAESLESGNSCYDGIDNDFDGKIDFEDFGCVK